MSQSLRICEFKLSRITIAWLGRKVDFEKEGTCGFFWILAEFPEGLQTPGEMTCACPGPLGT